MLLPFPAANRDPEAFEDADEFVIDRERNRHVAFGLGIHRCLGSNLARMELQIAVEEWMQRIPDFELADADPRPSAGRPARSAAPASCRCASWSKRRLMRIVLDRDKCQGHGRCYALAPELFDADDEGYAVLKVDGDVPAELEDDARHRRRQLPRVRDHDRGLTGTVEDGRMARLGHFINGPWRATWSRRGCACGRRDRGGRPSRDGRWRPPSFG